MPIYGQTAGSLKGFMLDRAMFFSFLLILVGCVSLGILSITGHLACKSLWRTIARAAIPLIMVIVGMSFFSHSAVAYRIRFLEEVAPISPYEVDDLKSGLYAYDDVWRIDNHLVTVVKPITISGKDNANRSVGVQQTGDGFLVIIGGLEETSIPGKRAKSKIFTGLLEVKQTNKGPKKISVYYPFAEKT